MTDVLQYDFCKIHVYDNYLIAVMNEGITVTSKHNAILQNIANVYYKNKPFVYLTHRIHSYSVDPAIYTETSKIENLVGFGVISKDFKAKSNAEIEKLFLSKPFEIFDSIEDAIVWVKQILSVE
jgi:hypothetical protein